MSSDPEKSAYVGKSQLSPTGSQQYGDVSKEVEPKYSLMTRIGLSAESFQQAPLRTDPRTGLATRSPLKHALKNRHLQMIAVGGSIGTGLFIGSGGALSRGGPLGILIAWLVMGFMLFNVVHAMGELTVMYPVTGGFYTLANRFIDPAWGFAMGWNYVFQWVIVLPLELTAAGITVRYWTTDVNVAVWITIFWGLIIFLNVFGVIMFGEEEFWSSCLKLGVCLMFILIAIVCNCGGGPASGMYSEYVGGRYWQDPGPLANGFKGVCSVFVTAAFSFAGTELVGLAAAESENPRKNLPKAVKQVFWRITIFYILTLLLIGLLLPYNDQRLLGASYDANTSPFVLVIRNAGIGGLDHLINATITISVLSIGFSCVYGGSRTLTALADEGFAPKVFSYVDKAGRPLWSTVLALAFGAIAYVNVASVGTEVFDWLLAVSGLSTLFTWGSICFSHIRFRSAWKAQGHTLDEIPVKAAFGVFGSWCGLILVILVLIAQFYVAIFPIGGSGSAESFFKAYLALPIVLLFYLAGWLIYRTRPLRLMEIDLDNGRRCFETVEEIRSEKERKALKPLYWRVWDFLC